jgi:hypothetical protein
LTAVTAFIFATRGSFQLADVVPKRAPVNSGAELGTEERSASPASSD